jgi:hypothetical protein
VMVLIQIIYLFLWFFMASVLELNCMVTASWTTEESVSISVRNIHNIQSGSEAQPCSYRMDIGDSFLGVKRPGFESDHYFNPMQRLSMEI